MIIYVCFVLELVHLLLFSADVFKTARPLGNFAAVLLTYIASSVLHVSDHLQCCIDKNYARLVDIFGNDQHRLLH